MSDVAESYATYEGDREDARFTEWLRERSEPAWTKAVEHRFTRELGEGTIDDEVFSTYLIQDYVFVGTLVSLVGCGIGQAPTMVQKRRLVEFADAITDEEDDYFARSFDALSVPENDRVDPPKHAVTAGFEDLLLRAAHEGGYAETLAVLVPVEWVYLEWATAVEEQPEPFYLAEWIELHDNPGFEAVVSWLRDQLDSEGPTLSPRRQDRVAGLFTRAVDYEVAFFEMVYE
ncbi:TenA family protein [Natronorarus salvus]|uniref:TenA family protein n=1 Tax=Natronorarus salvus TaxID=3117733 RepID=UPI002F26CE75